MATTTVEPALKTAIRRTPVPPESRHLNVSRYTSRGRRPRRGIKTSTHNPISGLAVEGDLTARSSIYKTLSRQQCSISTRIVPSLGIPLLVKGNPSFIQDSISGQNEIREPSFWAVNQIEYVQSRFNSLKMVDDQADCATPVD